MDGLGPSKSYTLTFYGYPKRSLFTVNDAINKELQVSQRWSIKLASNLDGGIFT